jgi:hypothetical protein
LFLNALQDDGHSRTLPKFPRSIPIMSRTTTALVAPNLDGHFKLQQVHLDSLQPDEALVEIHASGVCHTDLACASGKLWCDPNAVLGHEGKSICRLINSAYSTNILFL